MRHASLLQITALALAWLATPLAAEDWPSAPHSTALPEVMLVPMKHLGQTLRHGGWILTYRNGRQAADVPDTETGLRQVSYQKPSGAVVAQSVSWEITRTQNNLCADKSPCPDSLRILGVPDGFFAVPDRATVAEGEVLRILIIPAGIV